MSRPELAALVDRLANYRVVVVGDVCLDEYLIGRASRLSREAPVPVLEFERRIALPGAAANPARNIRALGGSVAVVGVVGSDEAAVDLRGLLDNDSIDTTGLVSDPSRPTMVKTRVLADTELLYLQQVVRLDRASRQGLSQEVRGRLVEALERATPDADALLVSDYRSGVVDDELIALASQLARRHRKPIAVDSQGDLRRFQGYSLVRSNRSEAEASLHRPLESEADFRNAVGELRERLGACAVVITRGSDGLVVGTETEYRSIPAANRSEVFDAVGAGDTVIAVLALGLAAGENPCLVAELANVAAGLVVRRFGNAVATPDELKTAAATYVGRQ